MEPYIGQLALFAFNRVPRGWAPCDGKVLSIPQNQYLFALIGTQFGGDGASTFALPTIPGPMPGLQYCIAVTGTFPSEA